MHIKIGFCCANKIDEEKIQQQQQRQNILSRKHRAFCNQLISIVIEIFQWLNDIKHMQRNEVQKQAQTSFSMQTL